jgi:hypothetical protein
MSYRVARVSPIDVIEGDEIHTAPGQEPRVVTDDAEQNLDSGDVIIHVEDGVITVPFVRDVYIRIPGKAHDA